MVLLEIKNFGVKFKNGADGEVVTAVEDVNLSLKAGEVLGIVGESGSGKSVTALSVLGLLPYPKAFHPVGSSIKFNGRELINSPDLQHIRGDKIAFIFQEPMSSLNPLHRIEKQIAETLMLHRGMNRRQARREVLRLLKLTGIKNARKRMRAYPFELSGGQRQRVMIAMAIANHPEILIADEPTTALDVTVQKQILDLLLDLKEKLQMSMIFITHDLRIVRQIADRVAVMHKGRIVEQGTVGEVFNTPRHDYTKTLISSSPLLKNNDKICEDVLLKAENLKVYFPLKRGFWGRVKEYVKAVDGISLQLCRGETLGIVGESGSGKTTLGMALAKMNRFSGDLFLNNININQQDKIISKSFRKTVQIVFQDPFNSLNPRMSVEDIVAEGLHVHFPTMGKEEKKRRVVEALKEVGLTAEASGKYPHEFSGGQRQRIAIARALILEPELLILDEPTSALDVTVQKQIIELLQRIQRERNLAYIFISHDMKAVKAMSDRIAVMKDGKIVELGNRDDIFENPRDKYTQTLIAASI